MQTLLSQLDSDVAGTRQQSLQDMHDKQAAWQQQLQQDTQTIAEWFVDGFESVAFAVGDAADTLYELFTSPNYWHEVGQVFLGYKDALVHTVQGLWHMAWHPIQTVQGLIQAVTHPVDTFNAIKADYIEKLKTNRGRGEIVGDFLISLASAGTAKAIKETGVVAKIARRIPRRKQLRVADDIFDASKNELRVLNPNCFPAGTLVATETGQRPIEEVQAGERVWAYDLVAGAWRLRHVLETYEFVNDEFAELQVGGEKIVSTAGHPFWVVRGENLEDRPRPKHIREAEAELLAREASLPGRWVDAGDLRSGDVLYLKDGRQAPVESVELFEERQITYNFAVEELHCYAVGPYAVLVHNNCGVQANRAAAKDAEALTEHALRDADDFAGKQVTIETSSGKRSVIDFVTNERKVVDTKLNSGRLSRNQNQLLDDIENGREVIPRGQNAFDAGLEPGEPTTLNGFVIDRIFSDNLKSGLGQ